MKNFQPNVFRGSFGKFREFTGEEYTKIVNRGNKDLVIPRTKKPIILAKRYPKEKDRAVEELFTEIIIDPSNDLEVFFQESHALIRPWDLQHLEFDLKKLKEKIVNNPEIRHQNRWLAACDYFLAQRALH